jgi:hypothetical protein
METVPGWQDRQILPKRYLDEFRKSQTKRNLPVSREAETSDYLQIKT